MNVAVQDLHVVIDAAKKLGGKVVLGGHSLGGSVVTAYATWDFDGHAGADQLAGLVYIDGGSTSTPISAQAATQALQALEVPNASPWLAFGGIAAPYAGLFEATGAASALLDPNAPSLGQTSGLLPSDIVPSVRVTNLGQYGYALNASTSPSSLLAAQAHLGQGIAAQGPIHGWNGSGALTPIDRFATMFSGQGIQNANGTEWYFPQRLTDDTGAVDNGNANPAQSVLDVDATMGHSLPKNLSDLCLWRTPGWSVRATGRTDLGPAVGYPDEQPHPGELPEHLFSQRPGRRLSQQRLLQPPHTIPGEGCLTGLGTSLLDVSEPLVDGRCPRHPVDLRSSSLSVEDGRTPARSCASPSRRGHRVP